MEKEQKNTQMLFLWKKNNKEKKCYSFGKGTIAIENDVPLEKEQQKEKVLFLWKRNNRKKK